VSGGESLLAVLSETAGAGLANLA